MKDERDEGGMKMCGVGMGRNALGLEWALMHYGVEVVGKEPGVGMR